MKDILRRGTMIVGTALFFAGSGCGPSPEAGEICTANGTSAWDPDNMMLFCEGGQWQSRL